jgi:meiotic recombination protein SPO11
MDLDILSDILTDDQPALTGSLPTNLPYRELITDKDNPEEHCREIAHSQPLKSNQAGAVISKIEDIFESIADSILDEKKEMVIRLKMRKKSGSRTRTDGDIENLGKDETRAVKFPSKNPQEAWKFSKQSKLVNDNCSS